MARARPSDTDADGVRDALGLLTRDRRLLAGLFKELDLATDQQLDPLARRICKMLRVHLQIKGEILYPAARRALSDLAPVERAEQEIGDIQRSIMRMESLSSDDAAFLATLGSLAEQVESHLQREQSELFLALRSTPMDLVAIGITLVERRDTLMEVLGLHADDEEAAIYPAENPALARVIAERGR